MRKPLVQRREMLADVCEKLDVPQVEFSLRVIGCGTAFYQWVVAGGPASLVCNICPWPKR